MMTTGSWLAFASHRAAAQRIVFVVWLAVGAGAPAVFAGDGVGRPFATRSMQDAAAGPARKSAGPLIDHGGPVLTSSTAHVIYWGTPSDFPPDLESGIEALLSGFDGSSYLGITQQ
jgi:hypothetical protein